MAYTPHGWKTKETIATERMNAIEQGIQAASEAAEKAADAGELRAAFDILESQTRAAIRALEARITALENK